MLYIYAKNPATRVVAIKSASEMKFWCIKDAIDSPSTVRTTPYLDTNVWKTLVPRCESRAPLRPKTIGRAGGKPVDTQNQVLAIMKYQFFWKQAYQGTGSQRYSSEEVTDSIQMGLHPLPPACSMVPAPPEGRRLSRNLLARKRGPGSKFRGLCGLHLAAHLEIQLQSQLQDPRIARSANLVEVRIGHGEGRAADR